MAENEVRILVRAEDKASDTLKAVQDRSGGLAHSFSNVLQPAAIALGAGIAGLGAFMATSVREAMESQKVTKQLESVLQSTGQAAGFTKDQMLAMAASFQRETAFSDEAVLSAQNLLLTFTQIKGPAFEQATEAVLNMSTALGQDLQSSAIQVGKALNDPVGGVTALRRVGVQLTDQQEEMIKKMVEAGDVMGAQKVILGELTTEFGGSAQAAAETFGGRMAQLKNAFGEVQESIGTLLLPVLAKLATALSGFLLAHQADIQRVVGQWLKFASSEVFPRLISAFKSLAPIAVDVAEALADFFKTDVLPKLKDLAGIVADIAKRAFPTLKDVAERAFAALREGMDFIGKHKEILAALAIAIVAVLVPGFVAWALSAAAAALATIAATAPIIAITAAIALLVLGIIEAVKHWDDIKAKIVEVWNTVKDFLSDNWKEIAALALLLFTGPGGLIFIFSTNAFGIRDTFVHAIKEIPGLLLGVGTDIGNAIVGGLETAAKAGLNAVISLFERAINAIVGGWNSLKFNLPKVDLGPLGSIGGGTISVPQIPTLSLPRLAEGGIVMSPTLALLGEAGPEVVRPLRAGSASGAAAAVAAGGSGGVRDVHLHVHSRYPPNRAQLREEMRDWLPELRRALSTGGV